MYSSAGMSEIFGNDGADYVLVSHMGRCVQRRELWSMCGDDNRMARAAEADHCKGQPVSLTLG